MIIYLFDLLSQTVLFVRIEENIITVLSLNLVPDKVFMVQSHMLHKLMEG